MANTKKGYQDYQRTLNSKANKNTGAAKTAPSAIQEVSLDEIVQEFGAPLTAIQRQQMMQSDATKRANANVVRNQAQAIMGTDLLNIQDEQLAGLYRQADAAGSSLNSQLKVAGQDPRVAQYSPQLRQAQVTLDKANKTIGRAQGGVSSGWQQVKTAEQLRNEAYQQRLEGLKTPEDYSKLMTDLDDTERKANLYQTGSSVKMHAPSEIFAMLPYMTDEQLQQMYDDAYSNMSTPSKWRDAILGIAPGGKTTIYNKSAGPLDIFGTDDPETITLKAIRQEQEKRAAAGSKGVEDSAQALFDSLTPDQQALYHYKYGYDKSGSDVMRKGQYAADQLMTQEYDRLDEQFGTLWESLPEEVKATAEGEWGSREYTPYDNEREWWAYEYLAQKAEDDIKARLNNTTETPWTDTLSAEDRAIVDQYVNQFHTFSQNGYIGKSQTEIYTMQQQEKMEGWNQAAMGQYTGDDPDIKAANDAFVAAEAKLDELNDMLIDMDPAADPEQYAAMEQQIATLANELRGMNEDIKALAAGEMTDLNAIKKYLYGDASIWRLIGTSAMEGAANFAQGFYGTIDLLGGQAVNAVGTMITGKPYTSLATQLSDQYDLYAQGWRQRADDAVNALGGGAVYKAINNTISNLVENIPNTLMSVMSGQMMSAGELATVQNQAIDALRTLGMDRTAAQTVMQSMLRDPQYWLSFMREAGSDYKEALNEMGENADPTTAAVYAFVTAFINSGIEIGVEGDSGFEGLGKGGNGGFMGKILTAVTGHDMTMLAEILQSAAEEGGEEFKQGLVSGLVKKAMYAQNMQYISFDEGTDAVFNLPKTGKEMMYGALAGGFMAGMTEPGANFVNRIATDTQTGAQIIGNDQAQALAGIAEDSAHIHNKTTEAIKNGTLDVNSKAGQRAVGKLWRETYAGLDEASQAALDGLVSQPVQRTLEANGYEGDAAEAAQVVAKEYHGGKLTRHERAIMDDPMVSDIAAKLWEGEFGDEGIQIDESDVKRQNYQQATAEDLNTLAEMPKLNRQDTHSSDQEGVRTDLQQPDTGKFGAVNARNEAPEATADQATGMVPDDQNGTETARLFGETGRSAEDLESTLTNNDIEFNNEEVKKAYEEGRQQRRQKAAAELEHIRELNRGGKDGNRQGVVRSISAEEASKYNVKRMTQKLSKKQYAAVQALRKVAGRMNLNIVLYESRMNEDGKRTGAQGFYDSASDTVYLDMFAGYGNEQAILRTAAHELTHVIQKWSPEKYNQLQEYLNDVYLKKGKTTLNELLQAQMEKAANAGHDLNEKGAMDEVTADAMEMMLSDTDAIRSLAQKDEGLFTKIKNWIDDFVNSIRAAMEGIDPHSREAQILADMRTEWEKLQGMWLDAMNDAGENRGGDYVEAELQDMSLDTEATVVKRQRVGESDDITKDHGDAEVKHSLRDKNGNVIVIDDQQLEQNKKSIAEMDAVRVDVSENVYTRIREGSFIESGYQYFESIGKKAYNDILGSVELSKSGLRHIVGRNALSGIKAKTIVAVKPVIENGKIIEIDNNHNGRAVDTAVIAGKVTLSDGDYYVGVVVAQHNGGTRGQENHYSFHDAYAIKKGAKGDGPISIIAPASIRNGSSILSLLYRVDDYNRGSEKNNASPQNTQYSDRETAERELSKEAKNMNLGGHTDMLQFSIRSAAEATGLDLVVDDNAVQKYVLYNKGEYVKPGSFTADMVKNTPVGKMIEIGQRFAADKRNAEKNAHAQRKFIADIINMISLYQDAAMVWELAGSMTFSALKTNGDPQYSDSYDFGSICAKTQNILNNISATQLRLGRGLTKVEIDGVVYEEVGKGVQDAEGNWHHGATPCPVCYVYATWVNKPARLEMVRQFIQQYQNWTDAQIDTFMNAEAPTGRNETESRRLKTEMNQRKLWMKLCLAEQKKDSSGNKHWVRRANPEFCPNEILLDLRRSADMATKYPGTWNFMQRGGNALGKAIAPYSDSRVGETIVGKATGADSIGKKLLNDEIRRLDAARSGTEYKPKFINPFLTGNAKQAEKMFRKAMANIKKQNLKGGQRWQSWSDFRAEWGSDYLMEMLTMQLLGSQVQTYTKVVEAVDLLASAGFEVNLSGMPYGDGFWHNEDGSVRIDKDGNAMLRFSPVTGINPEAALEFVRKYGSRGNVQFMTVGISDEHVRAALKSNDITFVIPFHGSGGSVRRVQNLMSLLHEKMNTGDDYTNAQSDSFAEYTVVGEGKSAKKVNSNPNWVLREAILTGNYDRLNKAQKNAIRSNEYLNRLYHERYVDDTAEAYGVFFSKSEAQQIYPYEYWDKFTTLATADVNSLRFVEYCQMLGVVPRFSGLTKKDDNGNEIEYANFSGARRDATGKIIGYDPVPGYWKLLIDRSMYNRAYDDKGNLIPDQCTYHQPRTVSVNDINVGMMPQSANNTVGYSDDDVRQISERIVQRIQMESAQNKAAGDALNDTHDYEDNEQQRTDPGDGVRYSLRTDPAPKNVVYGYKAFYARDGKLYPPMVSNIADEEQKVTKATSGTMKGLPTPVGVWLDADVGGIQVDENGTPVRTNTTGRLRVKNAKSGGDASLAFRPGWHLGEWPDAKQFNKMDPAIGERTLMPDDLVFALCEISADNDYQLDALSYGINEKGGFSRSQAGLPWIPKDGYYKYRTNVDPTTAPWLIAGSIRVVDILDDDDCARICAQFGVKPDKRYSGKKINLADYGLKRGTVTADTEGMERFAKNDASRANDALLENALNDPAYANAYVQRPIDFDNPKQYKQLENEFRMNGQDIEEYRRLYDQRGYLGRGETQYSDRDYNEAVRNNDEDTLQQMVQEAAEAAMPDSTVRDEDGNLMPVYHGTDADFTAFDMSKGRANMDIQGAFFSPQELDASGYGQKVGTYYLDIKNPASEGEAFAALNRFKGQNGAGTKAREYLISQGYDGVNGEGMEYIAFYPEQIKSADPITYNDQGNVVPLSERFNKTMSDFRFSDRDKNYKTDREILAEALESVAANDEEKKMLADYKALASTLDNNEKLVRSLNEQIRNARLEEPDGETEKRLVAERNSVQKAIDAADKKLYNLERMAPMRRIAREERRKAENDLERAREHMQRYREGIMRREYIGRIERTSRRLAKWLTAPAGTSNNYVPEALRRPLGNFLMTIDKISAQRKAGGPMTEEDKKFANQLQQIEQMLRNIEHSRGDDVGEEIEELYSAYIDLPKGFTDTMAQLVSKVQERMDSAGTKNLLDEMALNELEALDMTLTAISSSITHINDFLSDAFAGTVSETAEKTIEEMRQIRQKMSGIRGLQRAADFVIWDNVMPVYAFERLGEGGQRVFRALRDGQDKLAFNAQRIIDIAEGLYTSEEAKEWSKEIVEFTNLVSGETIRMTVAHLMSLYALSRREQALGHLLGEGFRVADFKEKRNTVADKGHVINEVTLREMFKKLTERQKQVAESMVNTMSTTGSEWGNYVSMRRFGYRQFTEKNYFPIKSDSDLLPAKTDTSTGNELYKLLNMSMTKPLTVKANNRIMVESIFDVFAGHMADMALYNAMALPVLDAVKWLNYKTSEQEEGETAKYTDGVRDAIRDAYGTAAIRYVTELLKDVNGGGQVNDTGVDLTQKMLGKYNRVAVAANLRVALLQPLAIIRAANELPGTSLAKGTLKAIPNLKHEIAEMQEKSGIALWKSLGYRETNIGRSVKQQIQHMETLTDKISDKSMFLAELGDSITWGAMWKASKEYIRKTRTDLRPDTDEYWNAVVEKFENVIYNTQVVDSILTKSQLMRSSKTTNRMMSSFMSEPTTTFNTLMRAWDRMRVDMLKGKTFAEAWQKHGLSMGRTALVFLISAVVETVISQLMSAYRDEDDYETFKEKFEDGWFETLADNANPLTLLPGIKQLYEAGIKPLLGMETFDDQNVLTEGISTTVQGIQKIAEGKGTVWGRAYTLAKGISMTSGLPIHPVMREFQALWNNTVVRIRPDWRLETSKTPQATGYDSMYAAYMEGDTERVQSLTERLKANGYDEEKIESAMNTRIQKDLKAGEITQEEAEKALQEMGGLDKDKAYYKVQQIMDEDGSYSRFDNLEQAIRTGTGYQDAVTELTDHGYEMSDVTSKAKSIIAEMAIDDKLTESQIQNMLTKYASMTADEAYIRSQELKYQQLTGEKTTSDAAMVFYAIDNKTSPKAAIDALKQHGKKPSSIASSITSRYKDQYLDLMAKGKTSEAAALKGRLITVFDYLGYNGSDKIAGWEKAKTN